MSREHDPGARGSNEFKWAANTQLVPVVMFMVGSTMMALKMAMAFNDFNNFKHHHSSILDSIATEGKLGSVCVGHFNKAFRPLKVGEREESGGVAIWGVRFGVVGVEWGDTSVEKE
ncbi:hypothetical protein ACLOJK_006891 [Asimina triloba]